MTYSDNCSVSNLRCNYLKSQFIDLVVKNRYNKFYVIYLTIR